jgi:hypothetical protein
MAGATGLEPATSGVTGQRCNQLYYAPAADWVSNKALPRTQGEE